PSDPEEPMAMDGMPAWQRKPTWSDPPPSVPMRGWVAVRPDMESQSSWTVIRSEERRVGKEGRSRRWWWEVERQKNTTTRSVLWDVVVLFFFSSRRRHTRFSRDWSSDVCSSDLPSDPEEPMAMDGMPAWQRKPTWSDPPPSVPMRGWVAVRPDMESQSSWTVI